ncbi:MAG: peptidase [Rhodospirillales bacterium]|nr:peptidase [Rhodospirillales bacterium]
MRNMRFTLYSGLIGGALALAAAMAPASADPSSDRKAVLGTYADIAEAVYSDSLVTARGLRNAIDSLVAKPSGPALNAARQAWLAARVPYQQSEAYRFGNAIVDEWEGRVNAWPLDEGLIDYVGGSYGADSDENPLYTANVIANSKVTHAGETVDANPITAQTLRGLQEIGGVEANVATGYHAIEFLLWGQDLNGTGPGAGKRPWTDYAEGSACTNGNCERRGQYLKVAAQLLVDDLAWMAGQWAGDGEARRKLTEGDPAAGIAAMLTGLGSLSYGELAGERIKLGLMLHDPEEEHDCFSDNTHNSHYYDIIGMRNVWTGSYTRLDGSQVKGPSLEGLTAKVDAAAARELTDKMAVTVVKATELKRRAETVEAYDQMIGESNAEGNAVVMALVNALTDQTRAIERVVTALKLEAIAFGGSDSLDSPDKVFQK